MTQGRKLNLLFSSIYWDISQVKIYRCISLWAPGENDWDKTTVLTSTSWGLTWHPHEHLAGKTVYVRWDHGGVWKQHAPQYSAFIAVGIWISWCNQQTDWMGEISELHSDLEIDTLTGSIWLSCSWCSLSNNRAVIPWIPHLLPIFALTMYFILFVCLRKGRTAFALRLW